MAETSSQITWKFCYTIIEIIFLFYALSFVFALDVLRVQQKCYRWDHLKYCNVLKLNWFAIR